MKFEEFFEMIKGRLEEEVVRKLFDLLDPEVKELDVESDGFHQKVFDNLEKLLSENQKDNIEK